MFKKDPSKNLATGKTFQTPHTYVIIFGVVIFCWLLTFLIPVGRYDTQKIEYKAADGSTASRVVLVEGSFRYKHPYIEEKLESALIELLANTEKLVELGVDEAALSNLISNQNFDEDSLAAIGLTEPVMYGMYGTSLQDTSVREKVQAGIWGTETKYGFGVLNYLYEGLVTGGRTSAAVAIVMIILVIGGSFGVVLKTGAIDTGMYAFINKVGKYDILIVPGLTFLFGLAGAVFGMQESVIAFAMVVVPITVAMGYDSLVGIGITYVSAMAGNASSWMNPFSVGLAQGIAGVPVMSGAGFRFILWLITMSATAAYLTRYALKIKKNPTSSLVYESDSYFRSMDKVDLSDKKMQKGDVLVLLSFAAGMVWLVWGVISQGYSIPEIASIFFVVGLVAGIIGVVFKMNGMTVNSMAKAFEEGAAGLCGAALVIGMARGVTLVLGGVDADQFSVINTILNSTSNALSAFPASICAVFMFVFQTIFNFFVSAGTGQAALTMPIMAPLSELVGSTKQISVLAFQMGAAFGDSFYPTCAALMGVLGVARVDWARFAKWQYKMQVLYLILGCIFLVVASAIGFA